MIKKKLTKLLETWHDYKIKQILTRHEKDLFLSEKIHDHRIQQMRFDTANKKSLEKEKSRLISKTRAALQKDKPRPFFPGKSERKDGGRG